MLQVNAAANIFCHIFTETYICVYVGIEYTYVQCLCLKLRLVGLFAVEARRRKGGAF